MGQVFDIIKPKPPKEKPSSGPKKKNRARQFLGVVFIVVIIVFAYYLLKSVDFSIVDDNTQVETAPRPTPVASNDGNNAVAETEENKEVPTPRQDVGGTESRPESVGTTMEKSEISIRILNGAGQSGVAANTKTILEQQGFTVASTGTAKSLYSSSIIYYKESDPPDGEAREKAKMVQAALPDLAPKLQQSSITGPYDILVVVGKK